VLKQELCALVNCRTNIDAHSNHSALNDLCMLLQAIYLIVALYTYTVQQGKLNSSLDFKIQRYLLKRVNPIGNPLAYLEFFIL